MAQIARAGRLAGHRGRGTDRPLSCACSPKRMGRGGRRQRASGASRGRHGAQHGERWWEAELHRLRGVLLLRQTGKAMVEAEAWFQQALDIARRQQAKSLELRAAMSLARLWQGQGKHAEARQLLAPIYDWFTEGFDTADLREAKGLLEALP